MKSCIAGVFSTIHEFPPEIPMNVRLFPGQRRASVLARIVVRPCVSKQRISVRLHELGMSSNPGPISAVRYHPPGSLGLRKPPSERGLINNRNPMF